MPQTAHEALAAATLYSDDQQYRLLKLPTNAVTAAAGVVAEAGTPFAALLVDKDEVTLLIEEEDYTQFGKRLLDHTASEIRYRLITFDLELEPDLVGFMALVTKALAEAEISVLPMAAFSRDHLFVAEGEHERALTALRELQKQAREE